MTARLRVGAAQGEITPRAGLEMAGYIRRAGPADGVLDPLRCRAVAFDDGARTLVVVSLDLLYVSRALAERIRALAPSQDLHVMVAATHTHCGPGRLAGEGDGALLDELATRSAAVVSDAVADLRPARLAVGVTAIADVARNRRRPDGPCDDRARAIAAFPDDGGPAIATLWSFACHPTVLEHDTRHYSADFPGFACEAIERLCGGVAVFLQGCAADINPVFAAHTHDEARRVGVAVGAPVAALVARLRLLLGEPRTISLSWEEEVPAGVSVEGRAVRAVPLAVASAAVPAHGRSPADAAAVRAELEQLRARRDRLAKPADRRALGPRIAELWAEDLLASGADPLGDVDLPGAEPSLPLQAFRLGERLVVLALPGEPFTATGAKLEAAARGTLVVAGYANQSAGYLPPAEEIGQRGYEVGRAQCAPGTAEALTMVAAGLVHELMVEQGETAWTTDL